MGDLAEAERLAALRGYAVLDSAPEADFDDLTRLAAQIVQTPIALISLVDSDRLRFMSQIGLGVRSTSREASFCAQTVETDTLLVVPDARLDPRFRDNELVSGHPWVRFYAGAPLVDEAGHALGTLCVLDTMPRELTGVQAEQLQTLARQAMAQLTLRRRSAELAESRRLLDGLLEHSPSVIYAKDLDGRYVLGNPAFRGLVGGTRDIVGRSDHDLFPELVANRLVANDRATAASGGAGRFTEQIPVGKGGAARDFLSTKFPLVGATGEVYAVAGVSTDVTEIGQERRRHAESEQRWRSLVDSSPVAIGIISSSGDYVYVNALALQVYGVPSAAAMKNRPAEDFIAPGREDETRQVFLGVLAGESIDGWQWTLRRDQGEVIDVVVSAARVTYEGEPAVMLQLRDVSEQAAANRALRDSEANLKAVADVVRHIQAGSDPRQTVVNASLDLAQAAYVSLAEPTADGTLLMVTSTTSADLLGVGTPVDGASFTAEVYRTGAARFVAETRDNPLVAQSLVDLTGARSLLVVPVRSGASVTGVLIVAWTERIDDLDDRRAAVVALLADQAGVALRQAALMAELEALALTDALTGLPNRRSWDQHLDYLLAMSRRNGRPVTVAIADLDHFKAYNDTRGHQAGDELLVEFAQVTRRAMRASDTMARWGGEEFAMSLPDCGAEDAFVVLDRLRAFTPFGQTCSVGFATWDGAESAGQLLARADRALYAAKSGGRDRTSSAV